LAAKSSRLIASILVYTPSAVQKRKEFSLGTSDRIFEASGFAIILLILNRLGYIKLRKAISFCCCLSTVTNDRAGLNSYRFALTIVFSILRNAAKFRGTFKLRVELISNEQILIGLITFRDVVTKFLYQSAMKKEMKVAEIMSKNVTTCNPDCTVLDVAKIMKNKFRRRIPIVDSNGKLIGLVTNSDLALLGWNL
jgi:CBS domain-containing protein